MFKMLKRKRQGKTNYRKRLILLKSGKVRLVIRITNRNIIAQAVEYYPKGDKILAGVDSRSLIKYGWNSSKKNMPAAYLTGYLLGKKINGKVKDAIFDTGLQNAKKNRVLYSALKGSIDAGLKIPVKEDVFPNQEDIMGKHIKGDLGNLFEKVKKAIEDGRRN